MTEKTTKFVKLKYQVGDMLFEKLIQYNDGKFHTEIELNPAVHTLTEFIEELLKQERNKTIDECWRHLEKIDPWLLSEDELKKKIEALKS